jgi:hypothetical protein
MIGPPLPSSPTPDRRRFVAAGLVLTAAVIACSVYANLSVAVTDPADYRFFPPFEPGVNANENRHLGTATEYARIARSLVRGKGFADPFGRPTGPTAWMPPLLPAFLAGLLWLSGGSDTFVLWAVLVAQVLVLAGTGLLVLALARRTACKVGPAAAGAVFIAGLLCHFRMSFQWTHDSWLVLLALDLLIIACCWFRPLHAWRTAAAWGLFGGICTLVNPVVGVAWGAFSLVAAQRDRAWPRLAVAALAAVLTLAPWTARNYAVFGRLIPVKSNLAYELYQSQCLQPDGLIRRSTFAQHPGGGHTAEAREYDSLGESAYVARKAEQFRQAVWADPAGFLDRVAARFVGATLWYVPFDPPQEARRPWALWCSRLTHPLPFLALAVLILSALSGAPLRRAEWVVIGVYWLYLLPYVVVSYYERYAFPLVGVKVLLVIFAADRGLSLLFPPARVANPPVRFRPGRA